MEEKRRQENGGEEEGRGGWMEDLYNTNKKKYNITYTSNLT